MTKATLSKILFITLVLIPAVISQNACAAAGIARYLATEPAQNQEAQTSQSAKNPKPKKGEVIRNDRPFAALQREILADLESENFDAIEKKARWARREKERFAGGYWHLKIIYGPLTEIFAENTVTEEMWTTHFDRLKRWKQKMPQSLTARVALGQSYINYAWFARGSGYSNTVADRDFDRMHERLDLARAELAEADALAEKCPQRYESMLFLAMAQNWNAAEYNSLFEEAVRFEPDYYYYYYDKATNSLPRWGGHTGDWERYAVELEKLDSEERDIVYFLYVSNMIDNYYQEWTDRESISWERAKRGYKQLESKYGTDKQRLNQYALLASVNEDMPEAYEAFKKIGDDWDTDVFSEARFHEIKNWATARYEAENPK